MTILDASGKPYLHAADGGMSGARWWESPLNKKHDPIFQYADYLENQMKDYFNAMRRWLKLYTNRSYVQIVLPGVNSDDLGDLQVNLNAMAMAIDTLVAQVSINKPRPMFLTDDGNFRDRQKARGLQKFIDGVFYGEKVYSTGARTFLDCCLSPLAATKIYGDLNWGKISYDRVRPESILYDRHSSTVADPRTILQVSRVPCEVLIAMFPDKKAQIKSSAENLTGEESEYYEGVTSMVRVIEGWHLPSARDAKDGRRAMTIESATLVDVPYTRNYFPFGFMRYAREPRGFAGHCLAEKLAPMQLELNDMVDKMARSMRITSSSMMLIPRAANVPESFITSSDADIVYYDGGVAPRVEVNPGQHPQFIDHLWRWYEKIFETAGISVWSATTQRPKGMEHAPGMQLVLDVESLRHVVQQEGYEQYYVDLATITIDESRDLDEQLKKKNKYLMANYRKDETFEQIKWEDVNLERDRYVIKCWPTNLLAKTPGARMQQIYQMIQNGMIQGPQAMALLDYPDLEAFQTMQSSMIEHMDMILDDMVYDGTEHIPEPWLNTDMLPQLIQRAHKRLLKESLRKTPEDRLDLIWSWITEANDMNNAHQAEQAAAMAQAQPGGGPAGGAPPPPELAPGGGENPLQNLLALPQAAGTPQ